MKILSFATAIALLSLTSGCLFGDRFGTGKTVSVAFLPPSGQSAVHLSGDSPEVQVALKIVDSVLVPDGLTRDANPPTQEPNGLVAYYHYTPERPSSCGVFVDGDRLNVVFRERQQRHTSPQVERLCATLVGSLKAQFGDKLVSVR
jgi:hypothetical protein